MPKKIDTSNHSVVYWYFRPFWVDALNLVEPLPTTLKQYLKKYAKEDDEEFSERAKCLAQLNVCALIVEATLSMLFSTNIEITSEKYQTEVQNFCNRATLAGDSLVDFLREQAGTAAFTYGFVDVMVDMPEADPNDVLSENRQKALGIQPFAFPIPPVNRVNWKVNDNGNFTNYRSEDVLNTQLQARLNLSPTGESKKEYTDWSLDDVTRYDGTGAEIDTKPNPYGFIPVVTLSPVAKSLRYPNERLGRSLLQDVLPLQKLILNIMSLIYDYHEAVNFPARVLKQDTSDGDEAPTEAEISEQGNRRGMILKGKESDYKLVEPNPRGVESMVAYLQCLIERCYQQVSMPSDSNTNKTHQTGETIRSNGAVLFNKLTIYTKNISKAAKEIVEMALRVQGIDPYEANVTVQWDTNFSYESFTNALEQLSILKQVVSDMSPSAVSEFTKKTLSPQFYGESSHVYAKIATELDKWVKEQEKAPEIGADGLPLDADPQQKPKTIQQQNTQIAGAEKIEESAEFD